MNIKQKTVRTFSRKEAGFTLLLAALVASIVLSIGSAIFAIAEKQLQLSSISRESEFAFYAADTAAECALYWDVRNNYFATTTPSGVNPTCDTHSIALTSPLNGQAYNQTCNGQSCYVVQYPQIPQINIFSNRYCVELTVTKRLNTTTNPATVQTTIHADGFNVPCTAVASSPVALERSVELNY